MHAGSVSSAAHLLRQARQEAGLTQQELARRARTSQAAVARYETGVVSPSVTTLDRLLLVTGHHLELTMAAPRRNRLSRLREQREAVVAAAASRGATNLRVFGSVARGEDAPDSDIDVLVDFDVETHGAFPLIQLQRELSDLLHERVEVAAAAMLSPEVAQRAFRDVVSL